MNMDEKMGLPILDFVLAYHRGNENCSQNKKICIQGNSELFFIFRNRNKHFEKIQYIIKYFKFEQKNSLVTW